jgi:hypothetical protein
MYLNRIQVEPNTYLLLTAVRVLHSEIHTATAVAAVDGFFFFFFSLLLTNAAISLGSHACLINGCMSSCSALLRFSGRGSRQRDRKCTNAGDQAPPLSCGGGLIVIINRARSGGSDISGGSPSAISTNVIPNDQISTFASYFWPRMSSGAIQYLRKKYLQLIKQLCVCLIKYNTVWISERKEGRIRHNPMEYAS